jgi:putative spermidine/putrescine transport system permease protein
MEARRQPLILLIPVIFLIGALGYGILNLVTLSLADKAEFFFQFFARSDYRDALLRTHVISLLTTAFCILLGYPLATYIHRYPGNKNMLIVMVLTPWLVSIVVRSFGWVVLLGPKGLINSLLLATGLIDTPLRLMFNTTGVVIGMVHLFVPFMVLSILAVLTQIDHALSEASMSLGANPFVTFRRVLFPLTLPGILSGSILVYLSATGAVVTPLLLGGLREKMIGTQIYVDMFTAFDLPKASAMAVLLVLSSVVVIIPMLLFERHLSRKQALKEINE